MTVTFCAVLVVALAAYQGGAAELRLSPTRVLAHYQPVEATFRFMQQSLYNQSGRAVTSSTSAQSISAGQSHEFYFTVDTAATTGTVSATLRVSQQ